MPNSAKDGMINHVGADGHVSAEDVIFLRRTIFADGVVSRDELATLFELGRRAPAGDPEWADYFAEAASDFFLREEEPHGYLTDEEFEHLSSLIGRSGPTALELGLLVMLMEKATATPPAMADFVADEFRRTIGAHKGGPRNARADAELLRRYLYAAGGAGAVAVTREEAELLFDLHDMTAGANNDPAFSDLFIKGIAAHLMAHVGYKPLPREEALRLHDWVKDQTVDPAGFFSRMVSGGLEAIFNAYAPKKSAAAKKNEDNAIAAAIAEQVTAQEADWLADRIGRNGHVDEIERALLNYMRGLEADLPPKLAALVEKAA
jgi:hypothetical protein